MRSNAGRRFGLIAMYSSYLKNIEEIIARIGDIFRESILLWISISYCSCSQPITTMQPTIGCINTRRVLKKFSR